MLLPCTTDVMSGGERIDSMAFCLSLLAGELTNAGRHAD